MIGHPLGDFLREHRLRTVPRDAVVGRGTAVRRALRRQDVAALAGISTSYYTQLEQGRRTNPSARVLSRLADALDLGPLARARLAELAALPLAATDETPRPSPSLRRAIAAFDHVPAMVADDATTIAIVNRRWSGLHVGFTVADNLTRMVFTDPAASRFFRDHATASLAIVRHLRRHATVPAVVRLAEALGAESEAFERLWRTPVLPEPRTTHSVTHPNVGALEFAHQAYRVPDAPGWHVHVLLPATDETTRSVPLLDLFAGPSAD